MGSASGHDTDERQKRAKIILVRYLCISAFCLLFFIIYNHFSHEIRSPWMTWLFAWPLVLGAVPAALEYLGLLPGCGAAAGEGGERRSAEREAGGRGDRGRKSENRRSAEREAGGRRDRGRKEEGRTREGQESMDRETGGIPRDIYRFGIAALTCASLLKGILEIAGTDSVFADLLLAAGFVMLLAGAAGYLMAVRKARGAAGLP